MSKKRKIPWLILLGAALLAAGLVGLYRTPMKLQYVFQPGAAGWEECLEQAEKKLAEAFPALSLHGSAGQVSLTAGSRTQGEVTLWEVAGGYQEVYPRDFKAGRPLSRGDRGQPLLVLGEDLAFRLFGDRDPLEQLVQLNEKEYMVVGVARRQRSVEDTDLYAAWIPMGVAGAPEVAVMTLSTVSAGGADILTLFRNGAKEALGEGQAYSLSQERTRALTLPWVVLMLLAIRLLAALFRLDAQWIRKSWKALRAQAQTRYLYQMAGSILGRMAGIILPTVALVGAAAGLAIWAGRWMTAFPEWVPEVLVDPAAIARRFWELISASAKTVQYRTPEVAAIRFWGGLARWGTVLALVGAALRGRRTGAEEEPAKEKSSA